MGIAGAQGEEWLSEMFWTKTSSLEYIITSENGSLKKGVRSHMFLEDYLHFLIITVNSNK